MTFDLSLEHVTDPALLSLQCLPTVAALIPSTAWALLSSMGVALRE